MPDSPFVAQFRQKHHFAQSPLSRREYNGLLNLARALDDLDEDYQVRERMVELLDIMTDVYREISRMYYKAVLPALAVALLFAGAFVKFLREMVPFIVAIPVLPWLGIALLLFRYCGRLFALLLRDEQFDRVLAESRSKVDRLYPDRQDRLLPSKLIYEWDKKFYRVVHEALGTKDPPPT